MKNDMTEVDTREQCKSKERVTYYNFNGLVDYSITNLVSLTTINIPFEIFHEKMQILLKIKTYRVDGYTIVNGEKYKETSNYFFKDLKKLGDEYFLRLYNESWKDCAVSKYKFLLPKTIESFHIKIEESIKQYAEIINSEE